MREAVHVDATGDVLGKALVGMRCQRSGQACASSGDFTKAVWRNWWSRFFNIFNILLLTSRYPVGISTEFCFRWQKKSSRWEGEGDKGGGGGRGKKTGEKTEGEKRKKWKGKKETMREREN